jgi:protein-tyrosine phosphatase
MAERLLRAGLERRGIDDIYVHSAGTGALVGAPMTAEMEDLVRTHGAEPSGHAARALVKEMVDDATLVLALPRRHRGQGRCRRPRRRSAGWCRSTPRRSTT